jgi:hypothetical protein
MRCRALGPAASCSRLRPPPSWSARFRGRGRRCAADPPAPASSSRASPAPAPPGALTSRETEALRLIARGPSNADISDTVVIAGQAGETRVRRILARVRPPRPAQAVVLACVSGLITPGVRDARPAGEPGAGANPQDRTDRDQEDCCASASHPPPAVRGGQCRKTSWIFTRPGSRCPLGPHATFPVTAGGLLRHLQGRASRQGHRGGRAGRSRALGLGGGLAGGGRARTGVAFCGGRCLRSGSGRRRVCRSPRTRRGGAGGLALRLVAGSHAVGAFRSSGIWPPASTIAAWRGDRRWRAR